MKKLSLILLLFCAFYCTVRGQGVYSRYDVNHNGKVTPEDVTCLVDCLLGKAEAENVLDNTLQDGQAAFSRYDVNHDGKVSLVDAMWVINRLKGVVNCPIKVLRFPVITLTLYVGDTYKIQPIITPADADVQELAWSSSDDAVVSVSKNGEIKAVATGTATVTAHALDGSPARALCFLTVKSGAVVQGNLTLTTGTSVKVGMTDYNLSGTVAGLGDLNEPYSVVFYYGKNIDPRAGNSTRIAANENGYNARCNLTGLSMADTYYYRVAVQTFSGENYYGSVRSFTVDDLVTPGAEVDMGNGFTVAGCDLGATSPEGSGALYAWGETVAKTTFSLANYSFYNSAEGKYADLGESVSGSQYDAARYALGEGWRIPSAADMEIMKRFVWTPVVYKGVKGYLVQSKVNEAAFFISSSNYWTGQAGTEQGVAYSFTGGATSTTSVYKGCRIRPVKWLPVYPMEFVDMGLSVKWATCNIGALFPEDNGGYYAWGETETKDMYAQSTLFDSSFTEYNINGEKSVLLPEHDAAHTQWKGNWRMPTDEEWAELRNTDNCVWTWSTQKKGYDVRSLRTGNSIFLPATGYRWGMLLKGADEGYYWSSSLHSSNSYYAWSVCLKSDNVYRDYASRYCGFAVRPVCPE